MNPTIQAQLDRLETSLTALVDSIASYNPSIPAASSLLQADLDLQDGLDQLQTHARKTARISSLRTTIAQQNELITSHLTLLAETRSDLLAIPTYTSVQARKSETTSQSTNTSSQAASETRAVSYIELLSYAKHIAKFTKPPVGAFRRPQGRPPQLKPQPSTGTAAGQSQETGEDTTSKEDGDTGKGIAELHAQEKEWLDPWTGVQVTPWPGEDVLKRGGLAELEIATAAAAAAGQDVPQTEEAIAEETGIADNRAFRDEDVVMKEEPRDIEMSEEPDVGPIQTTSTTTNTSGVENGSFRGGGEQPIPPPTQESEQTTTINAAEDTQQQQRRREEERKKEEVAKEREKEKQREKEKETPKEEVKKPKFFSGLDLYDPDDD